MSEMKIKKVGRTTGITTGVIETVIDEPTPIPCHTRHFKGTVWFSKMWYVVEDHSDFALPGDSGSLVVNEEATHAVGVIFSSNRTGDYGLMIPIRHVLAQFGGLTLVSGHGV